MKQVHRRHYKKRTKRIAKKIEKRMWSFRYMSARERHLMRALPRGSYEVVEFEFYGNLVCRHPRLTGTIDLSEIVKDTP